MRTLMNQEAVQVTGAVTRSVVFDEIIGWFVTGDSEFHFQGYTYYASCVKDHNGNIVFEGHQGTFKNATGNVCCVGPNGTDGNNYRYDYILK